MSKSSMRDNLKKQHATDLFLNSKTPNSKTPKFKSSSLNMPNNNYEKPGEIGKAGAIINVIISSIDLLIIFILFAFTILVLFTNFLSLNTNEIENFRTWLFVIVLIVFLGLISLLISNIIASANFLKGKNNKVMAGILCFLILNLFSGVFILVSESKSNLNLL